MFLLSCFFMDVAKCWLESLPEKGKDLQPKDWVFSYNLLILYVTYIANARFSDFLQASWKVFLGDQQGVSQKKKKS